VKVAISMNEFAPEHMRWSAYFEDRADEGINAYASTWEGALQELFDITSPDDDLEGFYAAAMALCESLCEKYPDVATRDAFRHGFLSAYDLIENHQGWS